MPNWCWNNMAFAKCDKNKILNQDAEVDFNLMVPMPETIKNTECSSMTEYWIYVFLSEKFTKSVDEVRKDPRSKAIHNQFSEDWLSEVCERAKKEFNTPAKIDEAYKTGYKYVVNYDLYGTPTWYEWSNKFWGCKWNASDTQLPDIEGSSDFNVRFNTPWNVPIWWFDALMQEGFEFTDDWEEEGGYAGHIRVKDREIKSNQVFTYNWEELEDDSPIIEYDTECKFEYCPIVFWD